MPRKKSKTPETVQEAAEAAPEDAGKPAMTSIQISPAVRDRLWKLKFRKTYDVFLAELCGMYEEQHKEG